MVAGMHLTFVYRPAVAYTWDSLDILKVHLYEPFRFYSLFWNLLETMFNTPGCLNTGLQLLLLQGH